MGRRGQAWSMDLIIGVLVFMLAVGIIYALLVSKGKDEVAPLRIESEVIATKLAEDPSFGVADGNQIDPTRLGKLTAEDYEQLKRDFGVNGEFCIILRDESGNITFISNATDDLGTNEAFFTGIGSNDNELNVTCLKCGGVPTYFPCGAIVPAGCTPC